MVIPVTFVTGGRRGRVLLLVQLRVKGGAFFLFPHPFFPHQNRLFSRLALLRTIRDN